MSMSWSNWAVRVYAAEAWVSLASRFAAEYPAIVDMLETIVVDPEPTVRLQVAQNLQVISVAAPERMWAIGRKIATEEAEDEVLAAYLGRPMRRFAHAEPAHCESILEIVRARLPIEEGGGRKGHNHLQTVLGSWVAQLWVGQGRGLLHSWFVEWAQEPSRYGSLLDAYLSALRADFFGRYELNTDSEVSAICDRAQAGLALILRNASGISARNYALLASADASEEEKTAAGALYSRAERIMHHAMNQIYFGAGANANEQNAARGLSSQAVMARFLVDYADVLTLFAASREPATLHRLIELYEYLIPGDPVKVFEAIYAILLGPGQREGYQHESLGNTAIVRIILRYLADHRSIFDDEARRIHLVSILQLFSEVGWPDALKLLYDLPDLLR